MKNKKIEISFNQVVFENQIQSLTKNIEKYTALLDATEKIIGVREVRPLKDIEEFICAKTGFKNIYLSATLLEVGSEYKFIEANHNKINFDVIDMNTDEVQTKQTVLDKVKENATEYLKESFVPEYNTLLEACDVLNKLSHPNSGNFLTRNYLGKYSINVLALNNSDRI